MYGVLKWLLLACLLPAHSPVCKVAAAEARTHSAAPVAPPCCKKCAHKQASQSVPAAPHSGKPAKPFCPPNCFCPLCSAPAAVVPDSVMFTVPAQPTAGCLAAPVYSTPPDGFPALLDRPPRV